MTAGEELERKWHRTMMAMAVVNDTWAGRAIAEGLLDNYFAAIERALRAGGKAGGWPEWQETNGKIPS